MTRQRGSINTPHDDHPFVADGSAVQEANGPPHRPVVSSTGLFNEKDLN